MQVRSDPPTRLEFVCDRCGKQTPGRPAGVGLFVSARGDEVRYEEPPLCQACAEATASAGMRLRTQTVD